MPISSVTFWLDEERKVFIENGSLLLDSGGTVLDVGCGLRPWEYLFDKCNYLGLEVLDSGAQDSMKQTDFWYDGRRLPQEDASVEMVLLTEVLEHSEHPQELLMEIFRILRPNGTLLLSMPLIYQEHETPFDFRRLTVFGLEKELKNCGFNILRVSKFAMGFRALSLLANQQITKLLRRIPGLAGIYMLEPGALLNLLAWPSPRSQNDTFYIGLGAIATKT